MLKNEANLVSSLKFFNWQHYITFQLECWQYDTVRSEFAYYVPRTLNRLVPAVAYAGFSKGGGGGAGAQPAIWKGK